MTPVNGGCLHYTDIKKFFKILLPRNGKKKLPMVLSKLQMSDPWPSWPSCFSMLNHVTEKGCLTHSHTMTPFDAPGKQAF